MSPTFRAARPAPALNTGPGQRALGAHARTSWVRRTHELTRRRAGGEIEEREWIMMAVVNIGALLEYGKPTAALRRVATAASTLREGFWTSETSCR